MCKQKFDHYSQYVRFRFGLSDGAIPDNDNLWIGEYSNSYSTNFWFDCWLAGDFELSEGAIERNFEGNNLDVCGCGLVLNSEDKLSIFFTLNGKLMGELVLEVLTKYLIN
jgi:hypothetical protein